MFVENNIKKNEPKKKTIKGLTPKGLMISGTTQNKNFCRIS
jgi:hypothetical protein